MKKPLFHTICFFLIISHFTATAKISSNNYHRLRIKDQRHLQASDKEQTYQKRSDKKYKNLKLRRSGLGRLKSYLYDGRYGETEELENTLTFVFLGILTIAVAILSIFCAPICRDECDFFKWESKNKEKYSMRAQIEAYHTKK